MQKFITFIENILPSPLVVIITIGATSIFSLAAALTAELAFGLEPCILCIYQRIPFALVTLLILSFFFFRNNKKAAPFVVGTSGLAFLTNSIIAFYHTGVEQKWWHSGVEGCAVPNNFGGTEQSMLENILSAPTARCDEIPWADPILNLSMANYNVILCFGLFALCALSLIFSKKPT